MCLTTSCKVRCGLAAALQLYLGFIPGFRLLSGLQAGLGFALDPGRVFAAGVPFVSSRTAAVTRAFPDRAAV